MYNGVIAWATDSHPSYLKSEEPELMERRMPRQARIFFDSPEIPLA